MAIAVEGLTKRYGEQIAVDALSFEVEKGQVLGFLGPNGAGKTTTMKILTGYLAQDAGTASIEGFDSREDSLSLRRLVGYLPEHNPLYLEMYVREYLGFVAGVYKLDRKRERVKAIIERTGLEREAHKRIGALSKGYRQRVGLAQALIHDPQVVILDEPTAGLDPNQLVEIRGLIRELGREKTVIFSTHIMQEVQALCDRVLIIHRGKLVLDKPIGYLDDFAGAGERVVARFDKRVSVADLEGIEGVEKARESDHMTYTFAGTGGEELRKRIFDYAVRSGVRILELRGEKSSVEDVFQMLTKQGEA